MLKRKTEQSFGSGRLAGTALAGAVFLAFVQPAIAGGPLGVGANVGAGAQVGVGVAAPRIGAGVGTSSAIGAGAGTVIGVPGGVGNMPGTTVGSALGTGANAGGVVNGAGNAINSGAGMATGAVGSIETASLNVRALENSNGRIVADREFGLDRARERMSKRGAEKQKATTAAAKRSVPNAGGSASAHSASDTSADIGRKPSLASESGTTAESTAEVRK